MAPWVDERTSAFMHYQEVYFITSFVSRTRSVHASIRSLGARKAPNKSYRLGHPCCWQGASDGELLDGFASTTFYGPKGPLAKEKGHD